MDKFPLTRTNHFNYISIEKQKYIVYNTQLNNPLIVDADAFRFLLNNSSIGEKAWEKLNEENKEVVRLFADSYLYLSPNITENVIARKNNNEYMKQFSTRQTFSCIDLRISEACNFGCKHCIAKGIQQEKLMSESTAIGIVDSLFKFKTISNTEFQMIDVHFGNREPLLNYSVIVACVEYIDKNYPELDVHYSINTNLSLLTKEMAVFFIEHNFDIYISLDGPKKGNDAIRVYANGMGTYSDILDKVKLLESMGKTLEGISVTITDENYDYIDNDFSDWCINQGFVSVAYDFDLINSTKIPICEKAKFLVDSWEKYTNNNVEFFGTWMTPFLNICNASSSEKSVSFCKAVRGLNLSVDFRGNIYACSYSKHSIAHINSIRSSIQPGGSFYKMVNEHLSGQLKYDGCKGCELEGSCCGQCEMTRECGNDDTIVNQCGFYREVTRQMLVANANQIIREGIV